MSIFAQTEQGDLDLSTGRLRVVAGSEETRFRLYNRILLAEGEWFLDTRVGFPYFRFVFVKNPDLALLTRLYREALDAVPGVAEFEEFTIALGSDRQLSIAFRVKHTDGDLIEGGYGKPFIAEDTE